MLHVILDPSARIAQLVDTTTLAGHDLTGKTVLDVADDFSWDGKTPDWSTLTIIDDLVGIRARRCDEVDTKYAEVLAAGFTPTTGPCAGKVLQTANAQDRQNWLTAKDIFRDMREAGHGAEQGATIRTADNENIACTFDDGFATLQAMADWGMAAMKNSWTLKDAINAADAATVNTIDITTGWP